MSASDVPEDTVAEWDQLKAAGKQPFMVYALVTVETSPEQACERLRARFNQIAKTKGMLASGPVKVFRSPYDENRGLDFCAAVGPVQAAT